MYCTCFSQLCLTPTRLTFPNQPATDFLVDTLGLAHIRAVVFWIVMGLNYKHVIADALIYYTQVRNSCTEWKKKYVTNKAQPSCWFLLWNESGLFIYCGWDQTTDLTAPPKQNWGLVAHSCVWRADGRFPASNRSERFSLLNHSLLEHL